jgi:hypothetical protein
VFGLASAALFVFRPIPPIGLLAAIALALQTAFFLWMLFFPRNVQRVHQSVERDLAKERHTNEGQWFP